MPLKIVRCGLNSDSSAEYILEMEKTEEGKQAVFIVPDKYSFMAEKMISEKFGGTGLNNKNVFTFRQLKRLFLNLSDRRYLSLSGKNMLLYASLKEAIKEDSVFYASKNNLGFLESFYDFLCELKQFCITKEDILEESEACENKILKNKLKTVYDVYAEFESRLNKGDFLDSEDDFSRLAKVISENGYFSDAYIWVDFFSDFSPADIGVLEAMLKNGADMTIYLPAKTDGEVFKNSVFEYPEKVISKFKNLCKREGIEYCEKSSDFKKEKKPALFAYSENFEKAGYKYEKSADEIKIFQAREKYSEVENAALKICDLVNEENYKYSDICVVCSDLDEYISFVEPVFFEYKIPYFSDYKVSMTDHPTAVLITALFEMTENASFSFDACMRYLRTGFAVGDKEADLVENHIIKRGIKGSMWKNPKYWQEAEKNVFDDITGAKKNSNNNCFMEEIRQKIMKPISAFEEKTSGKKTVKQMCTALFEFINDLDLFEKISNITFDLNKNRRENEALRFEQVWNFIVEITEQAVVTLGEEIVTREEFFELFKTGMNACEIGIIPSVTNGVLVSDISKGVTDDTSVLFILGADKNALPKFIQKEGILSDTEREEIKKELAPNTKQVCIESEFKAVQLLSKATDILYMSYPVSDISGESIEPSQMIYDILDMFCYADKQNNLVTDDELLYISSPEATIHKLLLKISESGQPNPLWQKVKNWYEKNGGFDDKLALIDKVSEFKSLSAKLSAETAEALYEDYTNYSISRIEKYFLCPFGYFLENGLKLRERKAWEIGSTDVGSLLHWAVCEYCKAIDGENPDSSAKKANWQALTPEMSEKTVLDIMKRAEQALEIREYETGKTKNMLDRVEKALKKSVSIINISMQNSKFSGAGYEVEFEEKEIKNSDGLVKIRGIIDRIDIYEDEKTQKAYIRIIDYKSGEKKYSLERILNRVDLQLAVYAIAAMDMYSDKAFDGFSGELEPCVKGVFYDKINNKPIECSITRSSDIGEERLLKSKLDGVIFTTEVGEGRKAYFDTQDAENMDYEVKTLGKSRYLKLEKKAKGEGLNRTKSSVESEMTKEALLKYVRDGLVEADLKIKSGDIEVSPYKYQDKSESACRYCPYSDICISDREKSPCRKREKDKKEILDEIMGGGN